MPRKNKKVTLINASAAKQGGAREILKRYLSFIIEEAKYLDNDFVVLCPNPQSLPEVINKEITLIEFETSSFQTLIFSLFGIRKFVRQYEANKLVSLNNLNLMLSRGINTVTYFHQEKAIDNTGLRYRLIRWLLKLSKNNILVVQTNRIKQRLISELKIDGHRIQVRWPGVRKISTGDSAVSPRVQNMFLQCANKKIALLPVYDENSTHKNFSFWFSIRKALRELGYISISLCGENSGISDHDLGKVSQADMDFLYKKSDILVLCSEQETLCLPLFEFLQTDGKVLVMEAAYIRDFYTRFTCLRERIKIISRTGACDDEELQTFLDMKLSNEQKPFGHRFFLGNWNL